VLADIVIETDGLEAEIQREKLATYVRISRTLEALILRCHALFGAASEGDRGTVAEYSATRERAIEYLWYLRVQREALGFRRHQGLDEHYPIPPPVAIPD
jgi:hypothetical protein